MFLNRQPSSIEQRYWFIKLKLAQLIWILRRIRHFIEFIKLSIIIFIDHDATFEIIKQIFLSILSIDRLNLKLIRVSNYIQRFNLLIKHKFEKLHLISNALFRLSIYDTNSDENELNVLLIAILVELTFEFRNRIVTDYIENSSWNFFSKFWNQVKKTTWIFLSCATIIWYIEKKLVTTCRLFQDVFALSSSW